MIGRFSEYNNPFPNPLTKVHAKAFFDSTRVKVNNLTPAGKRLLIKLVNAFNVDGVRSITRRDITRLLGRESITPHDIRLLNDLCDLGLIDCKRVPVWTWDKRPAGAQLKYSMDENTGWALNRLLSKKKAQDKGRKNTA